MDALLAAILTVSTALQPPKPTTPPGPPPPSPAPSAAPKAEATPPETYVYNPEGRRDPFASLIGTGTKPPVSSRKSEGAAGLIVAEISVRGVLQSRGTLVAMVQGPDNKTYIVHQGDHFQDGTIKAITPQGLVIIQEVNDPLSLVKQREIRKLLRALEDAKE